jgi:hypothetical protein
MRGPRDVRQAREVIREAAGIKIERQAKAVRERRD